MKKSVYVSCPVIMQKSHLTNALDRIEEIIEDNACMNYWLENHFYDNNWVKNCDIFILIAPNNSFKFNINELPAGCCRELILAEKLNKTILLGYINSNGIYNFYSIIKKNNGTYYEGVIGTSNALHLNLMVEKSNYNYCMELPLPLEEKVIKSNYNRKFLLL